MCGRYTLADGPTDEEFTWICEMIRKNNSEAPIPTGEVAPSLRAPVLTSPNTPALSPGDIPEFAARGCSSTPAPKRPRTSLPFGKASPGGDALFPAPAFLSGIKANTNIFLPCQASRYFIWRGFTSCFQASLVLLS